MYNATLKEVVNPRAVVLMKVCAFTQQGYIDVKRYCSSFSSTILVSQVSVIKATGHPKQYIFQGLQLFFAPNEEVLDCTLMSNSVHLKHVNYN